MPHSRGLGKRPNIGRSGKERTNIRTSRGLLDLKEWVKDTSRINKDSTFGPIVTNKQVEGLVKGTRTGTLDKAD